MPLSTRSTGRIGAANERCRSAEALEAHSKYGLLPENLAKPRIVLLASSFPPVVTATTVWLTEMSLDISLVTFQAYRADDKIIVTVSQLYPVADVEEFTVAPARSAKSASEEADLLPEIHWSSVDLTRLRELANPTVLAVLDLCSESPGEWVPLRTIEERAARTPPQARGDLAGLTMTVKRRFDRSNWPFAAEFGAGGEQQSYYRITDDLAVAWRALSAPTDPAETAHPRRTVSRASTIRVPRGSRAALPGGLCVGNCPTRRAALRALLSATSALPIRPGARDRFARSTVRIAVELTMPMAT